MISLDWNRSANSVALTTAKNLYCSGRQIIVPAFPSHQSLFLRHKWKMTEAGLTDPTLSRNDKRFCFAPFPCFNQPLYLFSDTLNFPHLPGVQDLNDEKSPQVPKLSSKYGPDSNYCGLKSVPSLQANKQMLNAFGGVLSCVRTKMWTDSNDTE